MRRTQPRFVLQLCVSDDVVSENYRMRKALLVSMTVSVTLLLMGLALPANPSAQAQASVELKPCKLELGLGAAKREIDAQCGVLSVPEDRAQPSGRSLDIHFAVLPATNPDSKAAPIFHLEGGPGGSALSNFTLWYGGYRSLFADHDVVLIDQRGTGKSASLQCTEVTEASLDDLKAERPAAAELAVTRERMAACLKRLSATTDPAHYTSLTMADDIDAVRQALGYTTINVFGNSYGTWLAQIYLQRHEASVNAIILDSVVGPWNFALLDSATNSEASLLRIISLCAADAACAKKYPDLRAQFDQALDQLASKPVKTSAQGLSGSAYSVTITRERFLEAVRLMLYNSTYIGVVPQVIANAANGVFTLPASALVSAAEQSKDISIGLYYSVHCAESLPFYSEAVIQQFASDKFFGSRSGGVEELRQICAEWRSAELDAADVAAVRSSKPVLILSGAFDPITPVAYGEETRARFPNSTLAAFPYQAHGLLASNKCAQTLTKQFLAAPSQPLDTACIANDIAPIFAGTFSIDLTPFSDPSVPFRVNVPKGWDFQAQKSTGALTLFASANDIHLLGVSRFRARTMEEAQAMVEQAIAQAYGAVDTQATIDFLGSRILQHSLDHPAQVYTGVITIVGVGNDYRVLWYAAPNNIFASTFETVVPILLSIN
jgi:pimeloyl-ACP methyl ester carboxylesterase